jgi:hypothetical protein
MSEISDNEQFIAAYQNNTGSAGLYHKTVLKTAENKVSKLEKPDLSKDETEKLATKRWDQSQAEIKKLEENLQGNCSLFY